MVAVISGNGLGLEHSSLSLLGGRGATGTAGLGSNGEQAYINSVTGNLVIQRRDEYLSGLGRDVPLVRTYNSQGLLDDDNSDNWRLGIHQALHSLTGTVNTSGSTITKVYGDGAELLFNYDAATERYISTDGSGAHDTLSFDDISEEWTWTEGTDRSSETYDSNGRLFSSSDTDGNSWVYTYSGSLITRIEGNDGQEIFLDYSGTNLTQIRTVIDSVTQTRVRYAYDGSDRLNQVTVDLTPEDNSVADSETYVTTYTYDGGSNRIASISQSDGTQVSFTYQEIEGAYRVKTYTDGTGAVTTITYTEVSEGSGSSPITATANNGVLSTEITENNATYGSLDLLEVETTDTITVQHELELISTELTTPEVLFESSSTAADSPTIRFDGDGNAIAIWREGSNLYARHYTESTDTWGSAVTLDSASTEVFSPALAVDVDGNAIVAWIQNDGTASTLYSKLYDAGTSSWGSVQALESSSNPVDTTSGNLAVAIGDDRAGVAWIQSDGTRNNVYATYRDSLSSGSWVSPVLMDSEVGTVNGPTIKINTQSVTVLWDQMDGDERNVYYNEKNGVGSWGGQQLIPNDGPARDAKYLADGSANEIGLWVSGNDVIAYRWEFATSESEYWTLDTRNAQVSSHVLAMAPGGDAVAAWVQTDQVAQSLYVSLYDVGTNTWSSPDQIEGLSLPVSTLLDSVSVSMSDGYAVVAWLQGNGTRNDLYLSRLVSGDWEDPILVETGEETVTHPSVAIDGTGQVTVTWTQSDGVASSIYTARYSGSVGQAYYTVPASSTWQSLANTLYGMDAEEAGAALQTAMGSPTLTTGLELAGLPPTLAFTTTPTISVSPYYVVQSGDTWQSIADTLYGIDSFSAGYALQLSLADPPLAAGSRLTGLPPTLEIFPAYALDLEELTDQVQENVLQTGFPVTGITAEISSWLYYTIVVPEGMSELFVATYGGTGDADLFVRFGENPTYEEFDARGTNDASSEEELLIEAPRAGTWYVGIQTWSDIEDVSLVATYQAATLDTRVLEPGVAVGGLNGLAETRRTFSFEIPDGTSDFSLDIIGSVGDPELHLAYGAPPSAGDPQYYSNGFSSEHLLIENPAAGTWYATVIGWDFFYDARILLQTNVESDEPPSVEASDTQLVSEGATVSLEADADDLEGTVTYQWTQISGPWVQLDDADTSIATFVAPDTLGPTVLEFRVTVTDEAGKANSDIARVLIDRPVRNYLVQSGDTWESIAETLYGTTDLANYLETIVGLSSPVPATRMVLPLTLRNVVETPDTVPAYYTVKSGDTWAGIVQAIYGTNDSAAVAALQTALSNPTLEPGLMLTVPPSLNYAPDAADVLEADSGVLSTEDEESSSTTYPLNAGEVGFFPQGWGDPMLLETSSGAASQPKTVFSTDGNGFAIWAQGGDLYVRRFDASTNKWSAETILDSRSDAVYNPELALDAAGNAAVAWVQSNGTANSLYARLYDAMTGTWGTAQLIESSSQPVETSSGSLSLAVGGGRAAVAWMQSDGTRNNVYAADTEDGIWGTAELMESSTEVPSQPSVSVSAMRTTVLWQQMDGSDSNVYLKYRIPGDAWSSVEQASLESPAGDPAWTADQYENRIGVYIEEDFVTHYRFSAASEDDSGGVLSNGLSTPYAVALAVDDYGNALAAWVQDDGGDNAIWLSHYSALGHHWSDARSIAVTSETINTTSGNLVVALSGGYAAIGWLQNDGTRDNLHVARYNSRNWSAPVLVEGSSQGAGAPSLAIDGLGRVNVVWQQSDGTAASVYSNRFELAPVPYYTAQSGDSWASIAEDLYGSDDLADQLEEYFSGVTLAAGVVLRSLPVSLTLESSVPVTVAPYYTVESGDTWESITETIYGTTDSEAVELLQDVLGNPVLAEGLRLTVPSTLSVGSGGGGVGGIGFATEIEIESPLGQITVLTNDEEGRLVSLRHPAVGAQQPESAYTYDADGNVTSVTSDPQGTARTTAFEYDDRGNQILVRDESGLTITRTFSDENQVLTETVYTVADPDGPGVGAASGGLTSRYAYDSEQHLRFVISAEGRVTEHRYNTTGNRVATLRYTAETYDLTGLSVSTALTEAQLETWIGIQDLTRLERTDYAYDFRGNLSTQTTYAETDEEGDGVSGGASVRRFIYDQRGRLLQSIDARGEDTPLDPDDFVTTYTYDGLGRLLTSVQWTADGDITTTLTEYNGSAQTVAVELANGLVTARTYDDAGRLVQVSQSDGVDPLGTTTYAYDENGRLRMTTDPLGVTSHVVYDAAGRTIFTVDGDGSLTEFLYDARSNVIATIQYADLADKALLVDGLGVPLEPVDLEDLRDSASGSPSGNRVTRSVYDNSNRLVYAIDATGAVVETRYDGASRITDTIAYAEEITLGTPGTELSPGDIETLLDASADDRRIRYFYDADGLLLGTLDGEGYLAERLYGASGRLEHTVAYATATAPEERAAGDLDALRPDPDAADIHGRYFYDASGRPVGALDGEGYLTESVYDEAGNVIQVIRYEDPVTYTPGDRLDDLRPVSLGDSQVTGYEYDAFSRVVGETDPEGTETSYVYDDVGNLVSSTRGVGTADERISLVRYDALGRIAAELTPEGASLITSGMTAGEIDEIWEDYGVSYAYDLAGHLVSKTDQYGNATLFYYDADNRLTYTVNAEGEVSENRYNALNQIGETVHYINRVATTGLEGGADSSALEALLDPDAEGDASVTYTYTLTGQLASETTGEGGIKTYGYSAFGDLLTSSVRIDVSRNTVHEYEYDRRGQVTLTAWDPAGVNRTETREYDAFGRTISATDQYGNQKTTEFDRLGRAIVTVSPLGAERLVSYDAYSRVLTSTDALGNETVYQYNDAARSTTMTTPEGIVVTSTHNRHGQVISVTTGGETTTYSYDANGQLQEVSDDLGTLEGRTYDRAGRLSATTDANDVATSFSYDAVNRVLTREVDAAGLGLTTSYTYDALGRVIEVTDPAGTLTTMAYDRDGRLVERVVDPADLNLVTAYAYDDAGNLITLTEGAGSDNPRVVQYAYDDLGRRIQEVVDPEDLNLVTDYVYDQNGNLISRIDPAGWQTFYVYDGEDRLRYTIDAEGGLSLTSYDAEGRVVRNERFSGLIDLDEIYDLYEVYDEINDLYVVTPLSVEDVAEATFYEDGFTAGNRVEQFVYDGDGRLVYTIDTLGGVKRKEYDDLGRQLSEVFFSERVDPDTYTTVAQVEDALEDASDANPDNDRISHAVYDARGRMRYSIDGLGGVTQYQYDGTGNVVSRSLLAVALEGNADWSLATLDTWAGANDSAADRMERMWYDAAGRLRFRLDAEQYLTEWSYDEVGREASATQYAGAASLEGDESLAEVVTAAATLADEESDRATAKEYDAAGRLSSVTDATGEAETYTYDEVGNRLTVTNRAGSVWTYEYDANRRMVQETSPEVAVTTVVRGSGANPTLTSSTETASLVTRIRYDALGNVESRVEAFDRDEERTTYYEYDALGRQVVVIYPEAEFYDRESDEVRPWGTLFRSDFESWDNPRSDTFYDAMGNAVSNTDLGGGNTQRIFDQLGRKRFEIDAENYVTEFRYDTFGNQTQTIRYAAQIDPESLDYEYGEVIDIADFETLLVADAANDRVIITTYDRLNRVVSVSQPEILAFEAATTEPGGSLFTASPTTINEYDAFGQVVKQSRLVDPADALWAETYFYYDERGLKTAQVDALGYLTTFEYDSVGNLTGQTEYSQALAEGTWGTGGYGTPTETNATTSVDDPAGYDRVMEWEYDQLNRRISEKRVGMAYSELSGSALTAEVANQTTSYGYDVLGNQTRITDANGASTYTYYDALGRQVAIAAPSRDPGNGSTLIPLTRLYRDAFGNVVQRTVYANGATTATESAYTVSTNTADQTTRMLVDSLGHVVQTRDALGRNFYASYYVGGDLGREWQSLEGEEVRRNPTTVYEYDRLGRQTAEVQPKYGPDGGVWHEQWVRDDVTYNSFGEVIEKTRTLHEIEAGTVQILEEFFEYDQAGRVVRSNAGDGVTKVFLYNLAGQATAEIRSQQIDLADGTIEDAAELSLQRMRTETRYDLLGRVVERRLPSFTPTDPDAELQVIGTSLAIDDGVLGPNNPAAVYRIVENYYTYASYTDDNGYSVTYYTYVLDPEATVSEGGGYYFSTPTTSNPALGWTQDTDYELVPGRYLHWARPEEFSDSHGNQSVTADFQYRPTGNPSGTWTSLPVVLLPDGEMGIDLAGIANGEYEYRMTYSRAYQLNPYALATGVMTLGTGTASVVDTTMATVTSEDLEPTAIVTQESINSQFRDADFRLGGYSGLSPIDDFVYRRVVTGDLTTYVVDAAATVAQNGGYYLTASGYVQQGDYEPVDSRQIRWNAPVDTDIEVTFEYRTIEQTAWTSLDVTLLGGDEYSVSIGNLQENQYEFRVVYASDPEGEILATATGNFRLNPLNRAESVAIDANPVDDAGLIAPIFNRPPGANEVSVSLVSSAQPDDTDENGLLFTGNNNLLLTFPSLSGEVRIELEYRTLSVTDTEIDNPAGDGWPAETRRISLLVSDASEASDGVNLIWRDPLTGVSAGGIESIQSIRIFEILADDSAVLRHEVGLDSWRDSTALSEGGTGVTSHTVSVDAAGNALAAWIEPNGNDNSPRVSLFNPATGVWTEPALIEASTNTVLTAADSMATAINGSFAAVAWAQNDGTNYGLYVSRFNGTTWSTPALVEALTTAADQPSIAVDADGNVSVVFRQSNNLYVNRYTVSGGTWSGASLLESSSTAIIDPEIAFDEDGNGIVVWRAGSNLLARRYDVSSNTWASEVTLDSNSNTVNTASLAVDADGNALVAWTQSNGTASSAYVNQYNAGTNTWSGATLLESSSLAVGTVAGSIVAAISEGGAVVAWVQTDGTRNNLYASHRGDSSWGSPQLIEVSDDTIEKPSISIDAEGNVVALWQQNDPGLVRMYTNRYSAASGLWTGAHALTGDGQSPSNARVVLDATGNGIGLWMEDGALVASRFVAPGVPETASLGGSVLSWDAPWDTSVEATFNVRPAGGSTWDELDVTRVAGDFAVDTASLGAGDWEYQVIYTQNSVERARSSGTFTTGSVRVGNVAEDPGMGPYPVEPVAPVLGMIAAPVEFSVVSSASQDATGDTYDVDGSDFINHRPFATEWTGTNEIDLTWNALGAVPVKVVIDYTTADRYSFNYTNSTPPRWEESAAGVPGILTSRSFEFASASTGAELSWTDPESGDVGGIQALHRIRVYTEVSGEWVLAYERDANAPQGSTSLYWAEPDDGDVDMAFRVRDVGGSWQTVTVESDGNGLAYVDLSALTADDYEYEIVYSVTASSVTTTTAITRGTFTLDAATADPALSRPFDVTQFNVALDQGSNDFDPVSWDGEEVAWSFASAGGDTIVFRTRPVGTSTWTNQTVSGSSPDYVATATVTGNQVLEFEILYTASGQTVPYASSAGTLNGSVVSTSRITPVLSLIQGVVLQTPVLPLSNLSSVDGSLTWTTPARVGSTVTFRYQLPDDSWQTITPTAVTGGYVVDTTVLPDGSYPYEIIYLASGADIPYAFESGTFEVDRSPQGGNAWITETTAYSRKVVEETNPLTPTLLQQLDRWGNVIASTDAVGNVTSYRYNQSGSLVETILPEVEIVDTTGGTVSIDTEAPTTENHYDLLGRILATRDANGNVNSVAYNAAGQIVGETHADGGEKAYVYDAFGNLREVTDEGGFRTRHFYDAGNQLIETQREVELDGFSEPDGYVSNEYQYDAAGQRIGESDGLGNWTTYEYDLQGNIITRRTPREFTTSYDYDTQGRKIREIDANGSVQTWEYDAYGRLLSHTDMGGTVYSYAYDAAGLLINQRSTLGQNVTYHYDAAGQLVRIVDESVGTAQEVSTVSISSVLPDLSSRTFSRLVSRVSTVLDRSFSSRAHYADSSKITEYGYDLAGRRNFEKTIVEGKIQQNSRITFDAWGRIATIADPDYNLTYSYDAAGNRTHTEAEYFNHNGYLSGDQQTQDLWYAYDEMNRVVLSQAVNTAGTLGIVSGQGVELTYNEKGERTSSETYGDRIVVERFEEGGITGSPFYDTENGLVTEFYGYDGLGRLIYTDHLARSLLTDLDISSTSESTELVRTNEREYDAASREVEDVTRSVDGASLAQIVRTSEYDNDSRLQRQETFKNGVLRGRVEYGDRVWVPPQTVSVTVVTQMHIVSAAGTSYNGPRSITRTSTNTYQIGGYWTGQGYDAAGVVRSYAVGVWDETGRSLYTTLHSLSYYEADGYRLAGESTTSYRHYKHATVPGDGSTTYAYNLSGDLVQFSDSKDAANNRYFASDAHGNVLMSIQGNFDGQSGRLRVDQAFDNAITRTGNVADAQYFFFANGQNVGSFGQLTDGTDYVANFDVNYTAISPGFPSSVPDKVTVLEGETLRSLAARIFGDASLWYVIAEENGLTDPEAVLETGRQLRIPNEVLSLANNAATFKPFDISLALGDTTPTQPAVAPKKKSWGFFSFLIPILAIVVAVFTAGILAGPIATLTGTTLTATGNALAIGSSVLFGGGGGLGLTGAVLAGAAGGAAGSAVSQGVAIAAGLQDSFSWDSLALAAIGSGVTAGLGASSLWQDILGTAGAGAPSLNAATNSILTQGIGVVTGLQDHFDWSAVAMAAVAAPIASRVGGALYEATGYAFAGNVAAGVTGSLVRAAMGGKIDTATVLMDAFGNALGNTIVDRMSGGQLSNRPLGSSADASLEQGFAQTNAQIEADLANLPMPQLDFNQDGSVINPVFGLTADQQRELQSRVEGGFLASQSEFNLQLRAESSLYLDLNENIGIFRGMEMPFAVASGVSVETPRMNVGSYAPDGIIDIQLPGKRLSEGELVQQIKASITPNTEMIRNGKVKIIEEGSATTLVWQQKVASASNLPIEIEGGVQRFIDVNKKGWNLEYEAENGRTYRLKVDLEEYDPAVPNGSYADLVLGDSLSSESGAKVPGDRVLYLADNASDSVLLHEFGHPLGFKDAYSSVGFAGQTFLRLTSPNFEGSRMANANSRSLLGFELVGLVERYRDELSK